MTNLKTALIASTIALTFSATPALAGDMYKTEMKDKADVQMSSDAKVTKVNDTVGEILQAAGQPDTQTDYELLTHDGDMLTKSQAKMMDSDKKIRNNAIVVPTVEGNTLTTVNCPIGTTAQPNMTCLVTGNYKYTS